MFGHSFYNETTRRYVAIFGTLFNDITITRKDNSGTVIQTMKVPVNYGPMQKFLAKLEQDPDLSAPAITLPRITFEITGITYDPERNLTQLRKKVGAQIDSNSSFNSVYSPAPYNLEFQLNIMTKFTEDGSKILEQIVPFFKPSFTPSVKLLDDFDDYYDVPIVLNGISTEDVYEGDFVNRRSLIWTLNFTLKGYYFGPVTQRKVIKFANVAVYSALTANTPEEYVRVRPGLTANGEPTTDIDETVALTEINFDDDWGYIVTVEEYDG